MANKKQTKTMKATSEVTMQPDVKSEVKGETVQGGQMEARPQHQGKDPLAEGMRLHNVSNDTNATSYEVDNSEAEAEEKAAAWRAAHPKQVSQPAGQSQAYAIPASKTKNASKAEQDAVAAGRKE